MEIATKNWGQTPDGSSVKLFTLINSFGNSISVTNYGATLVSVIIPDKQGKKEDIVLGFPELKGYIADTCYIGSTVGRYAGRIENARFTINNEQYKLNANIAPHILHGGANGFNKKLWDYIIADNAIIFKLFSYDGDQGFPGNLEVEVKYKWSDKNELEISYAAKSDKTTHINLTNHTYFNLKGDDDLILNHELKIHSNNYLPMKQGLFVTGEYELVNNTPFDFSEFKPIGKDIDKQNFQLELAGGYDHSFVLKHENSKILKLAVEVFEPVSCRHMDIYTTYPSVHLYTGNFLKSEVDGKNGGKYDKSQGFCLETQYMPNTPNQPKFPSSILEQGKIYNHKTCFKFCIGK
jgi:aldose 1-epimerase